MSVLEWKKFNLFTLDSKADYNKLRNISSEITAQCHNNTQKVFCDSLGFVHVVFRNWESISFQAIARSIKLCALTKNNLLVTLSKDDSKNGIYIQVFNLQKITKRNGAPCLGTAKLATICEQEATAIGAFIAENSSAYLLIAIGFERGDIFLHRSTISRDLSSNFRSFTVSLRCITGIEFRQRDALSCNMFVSSDAGIFCFTITENNVVSETKVILDKEIESTSCCALRCGSLESYFIVGRRDAVYCFTCDGRGPCYAVKGKKKCIAWFGNYLVVVVQLDKNVPQASSLIIIVDIRNKMIVLNKEVAESIVNVMVENENCYVLSKTNEVFVLQEKDMESKLRLLADKNLYDIALRLIAESTDSYERTAGQINMQYGDYLLQKGDVDAAVDKYIKTVGILDPYLVIRKLLDSRYNKYLAQYLSALIQTEFASKEYIELFLNCSERLHLPAKIEHICHGSEFDVRDSCHYSNAGQEYFSNASILMFRKLLADKEQACNFLASMSEENIYNLFFENGHMLISHHPIEVTDILKRICENFASSDDRLILFPERFIPMLIGNRNCCIDFLQHVLQNNINCSPTILNFLVELYLQEWRDKTKHSVEIIDFLKRHNQQLDVEHIFILCRNYLFWDGIMYLYDHFKQHRLYVRNFVKNCDLQTALSSSDLSANLNPHMWIRALGKRELIPDSSIINHLLHAILKEKHVSLLQTLMSVSNNKNLMVSHIKEFFTQEHLHKVAGSKLQNEVVADLQRHLHMISELLSNFYLKPIEFRSRICDICRQQLKLPTVYYLCQHSFHKECVNTSEACVVCTMNNQLLLRSSKKFDLEPLKHSNNIMDVISNVVGHGFFNSFSGTTADLNIYTHSVVKNFKLELGDSNISTGSTDKRNQWSGRFIANEHNKKITNLRYELKTSTNPFDDENDAEQYPSSRNPFEEYDSNLNPFND